MEKSKELELAIAAARQAGDYLSKREGIHADSLEGKDIKLSSDKQSEKIIMDILEKTGYPILSEEYGQKGDTEKADKYWIIDPLDGTMNYFKGMDDLACVSIALWRNNEPYLGVVYRFMMDELFYGEISKGAFIQKSDVELEIHTSDVSDTAQAVLATGFPVKRDYDETSLLSYVKRTQCFKKVRMLGAAALMSTFVGCGRVDAYIEDGIMLWDVAAGFAIVKAAGGVAEITMQPEYKCLCRCFATERLKEDADAQSL